MIQSQSFRSNWPEVLRRCRSLEAKRLAALKTPDLLALGVDELDARVWIGGTFAREIGKRIGDGQRALRAEKLMVRVLTARMRFLTNLVIKSPDQLAFLAGWTERVMAQIEAVL